MLLNEQSEVYAFEYNSSMLSMTSLKQLIGKVEGATDIQMRTPFGKQSDVVVKFKLCGNHSRIIICFGLAPMKNDRIWICLKFSKHLNRMNLQLLGRF